MSLEIERRFLAKSRLLPPLGEGRRYEQAYLSATPEVRVRLIGGAQAFVTIKSGTGLTRGEYEYAIPAKDARELLRLTPWSVIAKTRHKLPLDGLVWEIDCYEGDNAGLWSAEVELPSEDTAVRLPPWVADEVTEEERFNNVNLAQHPLRTWKDRVNVLTIVNA
jgi:CYTH domain-containing protein